MIHVLPILPSIHHKSMAGPSSSCSSASLGGGFLSPSMSSPTFTNVSEQWASFELKASGSRRSELKQPQSANLNENALSKQLNRRSRSGQRQRCRAFRLRQALKANGLPCPSFDDLDTDHPGFTTAQMEDMLRSLPSSSKDRQQHAATPVLADAFIPYIDSSGMCCNYRDRSYTSVRPTPARPSMHLQLDDYEALPLIDTGREADVFTALCHRMQGSLSESRLAPDDLWWDIRDKRARGLSCENLVRKWFERLELYTAAPIDRFPVVEAYAQYEAFYPRPAPTVNGAELPRTPCGSRSEMKQLPQEILVMVYHNLDLYNLLVLGEMSGVARRRVIELLDAVALDEIKSKYPWLLPRCDDEQRWFRQEAAWGLAWRNEGCPPMPTIAWNPYDGSLDNIGRPMTKISSPYIGAFRERKRSDTMDSEMSQDSSNDSKDVLDKFPWYAYLRVCLDDACWSMRARKEAFESDGAKRRSTTSSS